jgi:Pyruvate/2-oxoacid:ferredoxin oxidoreductase delta subunit
VHEDEPAAVAARGAWQPNVDAARCVHGASPIARCRACADGCPRAAFTLDDDGLRLDTDRCDGCAHCVAACPEAAIAPAADAVPHVATGDPARAFAACARVIAPGETGRVPCLDAMGALAIAGLHARGVRHLVVARADCNRCAWRGKLTLEAHAAHVQRLTAERGLAPLIVEPVSVDDWRALRQEASALSRRALLRRAVAPPHASRRQEPRAHAVDATLHGANAARLASIGPDLDAARCTACGVCARVCPHNVIAVQVAAAETHYAVDATRCTGCGLCVDSCDVTAVRLARWTVARPAALTFESDRCGVCGNRYSRAAGAQVDARPSCPVCRNRDRRQKLFQVQD